MTGKTPDYPAHDALAPTQSRYVDVESLPWTDMGPGMRMKCLYKDDEKRAGNFVWRPQGSRHTAKLPKGAKFLVFFKGSAQRVASGSLFPAYEGAKATAE